MGAPWHLHRDRFAAAGVVVRSSNYTLYGDMSSRVMNVLSGFTPDLEIYSIDEAFLGMGGFGARLEAQARALRAAVLDGGGWLVVDDLIDTGRTAQVLRKLMPKAHFAHLREAPRPGAGQYLRHRGEPGHLDLFPLGKRSDGVDITQRTDG
jgi:nucleotidyltransferase/DNA polymerase involved in DNA repair